MYDVFPLFHLAGFNARVIVPLITGTVPIFDPPSRPPNGALVAKTIRVCEPRGIYFPPSIIEYLYREPDCEAIFKRRDVVFYAGGPLSQDTGSQISKWTTLCQFYGSAEVGQVRQLQPRTDDWAYLEFHPDEPFELQPLEKGSDLHELVLFTGKHLEKTSAIYHNYPDMSQWRTKDLFERHPAKLTLWKFHARVDDILVFSSGEKLNPLPLESRMSAVPGVSGALVVGMRYPQPALLLELSREHAFANPHQDLWPFIEAANSLLPGHGRITRPMVLIATPEKPFRRAPKGSVIHRQTEELYADEIQRVYGAPSESAKTKLVLFKPSAFRDEDMKLLLRSALSCVALGESLDVDDNLFNCGLDSVKTAELVSILRTSLLPYQPEKNLRWLSLETIYLNPTIDRLSLVLLDFLNNGETPTKLDTMAQVRAAIAKYASNLPHRAEVAQQSNEHKPRSGRFNIAISGTTGFFGQYLLSQLVNCPEVSCICCLNRSSVAQDKFQKLGLKHIVSLVFLRVDIGSPKLGLSESDYALLSNNCDLILHNAWQVDFNLPLGAFDVHLEGIRNIITLCAESVLHPRLVFISSIASTGLWTSTDAVQTVPEAMTNDGCIAKGMDIGYAKSKYVAEHILNRAASESGIPTTILRLGHILPALDRGDWPPNDVLALFLQTSRNAGRLATDFLDTINWLPADHGARIVTEIVQSILSTEDKIADTQVLHLVNPQVRSWASAAETLVSWCGEHVRMLPMSEWVEELRKAGADDAAVQSKLPALRLLHFYDMWVKRGPTHQYAVERSMAMSKTMRTLTAPDDALVDDWLRRL